MNTISEGAAMYTDERTYQGTRAPVERAVTLLPDAYKAPEFTAVERTRVFGTSWVAVGTVDQVAETGRVILPEVAGCPLIVTRNRRGELRAFHNVCRHRATKLLDGVTSVGRTAKIRCPYHSWTYDLDGNCLGTPLFTGSDIPPDQQGVFDMSGVPDFDRRDYGLLPVAVDTWGCLVFVNLDPYGPPLRRWLGDLPERLAGYRLEEWRAVRRRTYAVAADYKLVAENFMEYYHLPWVHPELVRVSRLDAHHRWQGPGMYTGMCTDPIAANTDAGGWEGLPPMPGLDPADARAGRFVWLFPNTGLVVLPNHAFVVLARPDGTGRTVEETILLTHPSALGPSAEAAIDRLAEFWDLVNRQDIEIVERVQQGIASPAYAGGRMCYRFEEPVHRFQNMIIDRMVGKDHIPPGDDVPMRPMFRPTPTPTPTRI